MKLYLALGTGIVGRYAGIGITIGMLNHIRTLVGGCQSAYFEVCLCVNDDVVGFAGGHAVKNLLGNGEVVGKDVCSSNNDGRRAHGHGHRVFTGHRCCVCNICRHAAVAVVGDRIGMIFGHTVKKFFNLEFSTLRDFRNGDGFACFELKVADRNT